MSTTSDCEALLHNYFDARAAFPNGVEGQFSVALLDLSTDEIVLARDRFGIHPLFYAVLPDRLVFASEAKALAVEIGKLRIDPTSLWDIAIEYGPKPPRSQFVHVYQVCPGSKLRYSRRNGRLGESRYWQPNTADSGPLDRLDRAQQFGELLENSVRARLQGDGRVGLYVSGGIDSAAIAAVATRCDRDRVVAFSLGFREPALDEASAQRSVVYQLGCEWRPLDVDVDGLIDELPRMVYFAESPLTRLGPVAMMRLSAAVRDEGIKFVLTGEGADELLLGYPVFRQGRTSVEKRASQWSGLSGLIAARAKRSRTDIRKGNGTVLDLQWREVETKLSRYLLGPQGDRASMAHSVESRYPFLDSRLWAGARKWTDGEGGAMFDKVTLRRYMQSTFPAIPQRPKMGFCDPSRFDSLPRLLANQQIVEMISASETVRWGLFDARSVESIKARAVEGALGETRPIEEAILLIATTHILARMSAESSGAAPDDFAPQLHAVV